MRVTAGWVLAWSGLWWAGAAGKAAAPEATEVTRLVQQLSATSAASRDGAERLLLERGSTILPRWLPPARGPQARPPSDWNAFSTASS